MKNIYDELIFMGNGVLYAVKNGKAGLINGKGKMIADFIYDDVSSKVSNHYFKDDRLDFEFFNVTKDFYSMTLNGKMGVKDYNNNTILDFIYDRINMEIMGDETYITAIKDNQYAIFNSCGEAIIDFGTYDRIYSIDDFMYAIKKDGKWGCINIKDNWIIESQYKECYSGNYKLGLIIFENNENKVGMVDTQNKIIADFKYDNLRIIQPNCINAKLNGKFGIIDNCGNTVIECLYGEDEFEYFDDFVVIKKQIKTESSIVALKQ